MSQELKPWEKSSTDRKSDRYPWEGDSTLSGRKKKILEPDAREKRAAKREKAEKPAERSEHSGSRTGSAPDFEVTGDVKGRSRRKQRTLKIATVIMIILIAAGLSVIAGSLYTMVKLSGGRHNDSSDSSVSLASADASVDSAASSDGASGDAVANEDPAVSLDGEPVEDFNPHYVDSTKPSRMISLTELNVDGKKTDKSDYKPWYSMDFGLGHDYTDAAGVLCFRGNNFRNDPTFGLTDISENKIEGTWNHATGSLSYGKDSWSGSGWTGQPLMMKWPADVKKHMNMKQWARDKDDLVEVIYACMDGYIYFLDMETGEETRDPMNLGFTFKGAGALDPRGYPLMYVGAGFDSTKGRARVFIIDLLNCSVLKEFGNDDPFSLRGNLSYFDSSALVDAQSDTLIYPGENGILYLMKLNTRYSDDHSSISIDPSPVVKWHYNTKRNSGQKFWVGMEDSCAVYHGYLYIAENGGHLMCLNLNTMKLVWAQDILDDSNSTPVISIEDGRVYLYVSTSFRLGWRSSSTATVPVFKIDAETGEKVWQHDYTCQTVDGVSGGVQSTIAVGRGPLSDYIYVSVARTGGINSGVMDCLAKSDGKKVWEHKGYYAWSSPVCLYDKDGTGRVIYATCDGNMYLFDGLKGTLFDTFALSDGSIEASPAVYENHVIIGTRSCRIWGLSLR